MVILVQNRGVIVPSLSRSMAANTGLAAFGNRRAGGEVGPAAAAALAGGLAAACEHKKRRKHV